MNHIAFCTLRPRWYELLSYTFQRRRQERVGGRAAAFTRLNPKNGTLMDILPEPK